MFATNKAANAPEFPDMLREAVEEIGTDTHNHDLYFYDNLNSMIAENRKIKQGDPELIPFTDRQPMRDAYKECGRYAGAVFNKVVLLKTAPGEYWNAEVPTDYDTFGAELADHFMAGVAMSGDIASAEFGASEASISFRSKRAMHSSCIFLARMFGIRSETIRIIITSG